MINLKFVQHRKGWADEEINQKFVEQENKRRLLDARNFDDILAFESKPRQIQVFFVFKVISLTLKVS